MFGWGRLDNSMGTISTDKIKINDISNSSGELRPENKIRALRFYDHPLTVTEYVGNYRAHVNTKSRN